MVVKVKDVSWLFELALETQEGGADGNGTQMMQEDDLDEDAENAGKGGCGLGGNLDVSVCRAEWYFHLGAYQVRTTHLTAMPLSHAWECTIGIMIQLHTKLSCCVCRNAMR